MKAVIVCWLFRSKIKLSLKDETISGFKIFCFKFQRKTYLILIGYPLPDRLSTPKKTILCQFLQLIDLARSYKNDKSK